MEIHYFSLAEVVLFLYGRRKKKTHLAQFSASKYSCFDFWFIYLFVCFETEPHYAVALAILERTM